MATDGQFDGTEFKQFRKYHQHLRKKYSQRNTQNKRMENLYWMEWLERGTVKQQGENVKITLSPRARNKIKGFIQLLTATDPEWSVPQEINKPGSFPAASKMEKFAKAMWHAVGRIQQSPVHYAMVTSAAIFAETHLAITSTKDMLDRAPKEMTGVRARLERVADKTPFIFDVWNPNQGYPEFDSLGLRGFARDFKLSAQEIKEQWEDGHAVLSMGDKKSYSPFDMFDGRMVYTLEKQAVWLKGIERPLFLDDHGLDTIPIVAQVAEGTRLFEKEEKRREPFLWTLAQSNLPERENLLLTVMFTLAYALGTGPLFSYQSIDPDRDIKVDHSQPFKVVRTQVGERFDQVAQNIIDPSLLQTWQMALDLEEESTLRGQTLGEPLGQNAPYSMVALLSQAGRLPLVTPQRTLSWALGQAAEICFRRMKKEKLTGRARSEGYNEILKPAEIPDHFEISAQIDISMPFDQQIATNIAVMGTQGEEPLFSQRYAREQILKIGQSDDMQEEIWTERATALKAQRYFLENMAELAQLEQMAMQPGVASGIPGAQGAEMGTAPVEEPMGSPPQPGPPDVQQNPFPPMEPVPPMV